MEHLWKMGYSAEDLISNIFRVCKNLPIEETLKLDFVKVSRSIHSQNVVKKSCVYVKILMWNSFQEIGITHLGIVDGINSLLQMNSLLARLCLRSVQS